MRRTKQLNASVLSDEKIQMCNMSVLNHNKDNSNYNISGELSPTIGEYTTDITTGNLKALWWEFNWALTLQFTNINKLYHMYLAF